MAKNSFVLYQDYEDKLCKLSDEQMGVLLRVIFEYERTGEITIEMDDRVDMAFDFIKIALDKNR